MNIIFGPGALTFVAVYLTAMVAVGVLAKHLRRRETLKEFYLAGSGLGTLVLLLTLYATQYSGNALLGYPGEAYRLGFAWVMSVGFMMAVVVVYLSFAPELRRAALNHAFVTPGDWIRYRFESEGLTVAANCVFLVAMCNYLLAQLLAMGHLVEALSGGSVPFWAGVLFLGVVILVYETLGGLKAVAWTDCAQGLLLIAGLAGILWIAVPESGGLAHTSQWVIQNQPEKAAVPSGALLVTWVSTLVLVGFGAAMYPQALQRIYAASSSRTLARSLQWMVFMPLVTMLPVLLIGIMALPRISGLEGVAADQVMPLMLGQWAGLSPLAYALVVLLLTGTLAAIMSTADSVLLSLSSIISKDLLGRSWLRNAGDEALTRAGKRVSWLLMAVLVLIALNPRISLWGLAELKLELLSQTVPLFVLGARWSGLGARPALAGLVTGVVVAAGLSLAGYGKVAGVHAGVIGLAFNLVVCIALSRPFRVSRALE